MDSIVLYPPYERHDSPPSLRMRQSSNLRMDPTILQITVWTRQSSTFRMEPYSQIPHHAPKSPTPFPNASSHSQIPPTLLPIPPHSTPKSHHSHPSQTHLCIVHPILDIPRTSTPVIRPTQLLLKSMTRTTVSATASAETTAETDDERSAGRLITIKDSILPTMPTMVMMGLTTRKRRSLTCGPEKKSRVVIVLS